DGKGLSINEFRSFVEGGYQGFNVRIGGGKTVHLGGAPGLQLSNGELNQVRHNAVLGHGLSVQAIPARGRTGTKVGFAENMLIAVPAINTPEHVKAAEIATRERNADFITVLLEGSLHRRLPEKERQGCAEVYRRRTEDDRIANRLRGHQCVQA